MDERFNRAPIGVIEADTDGTIRDANERAIGLLGESALRDRRVDDAFPASVEDTVPAVFDGSIEERQIEEYYPELDRWFEVTVVPGKEVVTIYLVDVTDRYRDRQRIEKLRGDIDRLTVTNSLISDILGELVDASSRTEIAATICDRLGETDLYEFAWVGEREPGGEDLVVQASAGATGRTLEAIEASIESGTLLPEQQAIETGTTAVVQPLGADESVPEGVRRAAFADGLQSLLAIPLTYGSTVYGVVGIYAGAQDAFSERERASFETVGEMAGFAINASRQRSLLLSDTVVELTFELTDPDAPFVATATATERTLSLDGIVVQGSQLYCYLLVEGPLEGVPAELESADGIDEVRVISEYDTGGSIEVALDSETPLGILSAEGVTITDAVYEPGRGECIVELSPTTDVRRVADALTHEYDGEVIAKHQRERELTSPEEFRDELGEQLTDRQETAIRTAFFADYFESPRGSSAEEVANALDITGPTLLHHLRAAQRKLLAEFFDTSETTR